MRPVDMGFLTSKDGRPMTSLWERNAIKTGTSEILNKGISTLGSSICDQVPDRRHGRCRGSRLDKVIGAVKYWEFPIDE